MELKKKIFFSFLFLILAYEIYLHEHKIINSFLRMVFCEQLFCWLTRKSHHRFDTCVSNFVIALMRLFYLWHARLLYRTHSWCDLKTETLTLVFSMFVCFRKMLTFVIKRNQWNFRLWKKNPIENEKYFCIFCHNCSRVYACCYKMQKKNHKNN